MDENNVIVISSDEDEKTLWKTMGTDDHFQRLYKKVKKIIFNQTKRSYISNGFPYGRFVEYTQELETVLQMVPSKNTQRFIWRCVVRWLVPLKNCIREPTPLFDDWKFNYIVTDIMAQYINFKCEYYYERDAEIVKEQIEEIIRMLEVAFSCKTEFVLITFLKIKIRYEYRNILIPLFRAYLISPFKYDANDFCNYVCLILCYRQWKRLIRRKENRETVNEYACGQIKRLMGTYRPIDLTLNPVLPWEVPNATEKSEIFFKLHPHLTTAREINNGTRLLLASVWRDWPLILRKFIRLYEEYNGYSVHLEPEIRSVKLREIDINSDDDVILIPNDDVVIVIADDDDLPIAGGSISNMNHLKIVDNLKRLAEDTPPKSVEEQEKTEKALQNLQCRCGAGKQGTTMAVNQHLSKVCDISSLSKILGFSNLRSLSIQVSVYLSIFKNNEKGGNCNCRYLGSSFNENNICIVFDTTDEDRDDDDNYFVRDEVTDDIDADFTINDLVEKEVLGKSSNAEPAKEPPAAVASVIADLKRRAIEMGTQIQNRRPTSPILLSSDDDEPVIVAPPAAVQEVNQNDAIINEIVLSSSDDEAEVMVVISPRLTPPPMDNVEERPLRREKSRCITGEVSSTTSLGCSGARNIDNVSIQNDNILENAREVGTLSAVRTSSPSGNGPSIADYSDISDDELDFCLAPRQRWSKFAKVVEEATSSTSELPTRAGSATPSDNVIFSVPCNHRRRSNSSSPCHTRTKSPADNSRLISPSSTFRTRRIRRYRARHSRIPVRKFRTVTRSIDDSELPTCSRYLRRIPNSDNRPKNQGLENCKNTTDSPSIEKATCSRYVQKKIVLQNVEGEKECSNDKLEPEQYSKPHPLKKVAEKPPELVEPTAAGNAENVNEADPFAFSSKEGEQTPPVSEDVTSDLNKLMEDITNYIETPAYSKEKTTLENHSFKSTDEGREQMNSENVDLKETDDVEESVDLEAKGSKLSEEVSIAADVERNTMNTSPNACSPKNRDENVFKLNDPVSEHSYFLKMHKSASDTLQENVCDPIASQEKEVYGREENIVAQESELPMAENVKHNKSQCSISEKDQARMFENTPNDIIFPDNNDDSTYLRGEKRDSLEHSPLSSVENDFLVEDELSCFELDIDDDIESPAYEPIIPKTLDKANEELIVEDNKAAEEAIRPGKHPDVTVSVTKAVNDDLVHAVSEEVSIKTNINKEKLDNTVFDDVAEHLAKPSISNNDITTQDSIDIAATRVSKQMQDLYRDTPLHSSRCTLSNKEVQATKVPIDPTDNEVELDVAISESVIATESDVTNDDMNNHLLQRNKSILDISNSLFVPPPNLISHTNPPNICSIEDTDGLSMTESAIDCPNMDISVVYERPSSVLETNEMEVEANDMDKELLCAEQCKSKFENNSENPSPTVDLNQSKSDQRADQTNEHDNKTVSKQAAQASEPLNESGVETEAHAWPKSSSEIETIEKPALLLNEQSTLTPSDYVKISAEESEGTNESVSNQKNNEIASLGEENGDKEEENSNVISNTPKDQSPPQSETKSLSDVGFSASIALLSDSSSPNNVEISASSEKNSQNKCDNAALTSVVPGDQINGDEQIHLNLNESSIENEPAAASNDAIHVDEIKLPEKCDENILSESITNDSVESLPSLSANDSASSSVQQKVCKANMTENSFAPNQDTNCKKPVIKLNNVALLGPVMDENKCEKENHDDILKEQRPAEKFGLVQVAENAPTDVEFAPKKQSLSIIENVELLTTTSDQKMIFQERTSFESATHSDKQEIHVKDIPTVVQITTIDNANKSNDLESDDQIKQITEDESHPLEDNETSPPLDNNTEIESERQEPFKNDVAIDSAKINLNVRTVSQINAVFTVQTEVAAEKLVVSEYSPSFKSNDTLIDNELQLESNADLAVPLPDDKHPDPSQNIATEIIADHTIPTPSDNAIKPESHNIVAASNLSSEKVLSDDEHVSDEHAISEVVQNLANAVENSSNAELTVASLGSEVKDSTRRNISNEVNQLPIPPSSAGLSNLDDIPLDREKHTQNNGSATLMEKDSLSKDQSVTRSFTNSEDNFSENIPDTDTPKNDTILAVTKELMEHRLDKTPKSPPCFALPSEVQLQAYTEANLDASSEVQLHCDKSGFTQSPQVEHKLTQKQAKNNEATNDEIVSRENLCKPVALITNRVQDPTESLSKELISETGSPLSNVLQNGFAVKEANVESVIKGVDKLPKCHNIQEKSSTNDHLNQDQGKRSVIRAAKEILSIEDYAMVKSFQNVTAPLAEHCNAHITTVTQTHDLGHHEVVDKIQINPQNPAGVLGACQEQRKDNPPADYSTTSQAVSYSNTQRSTTKRRQRANKKTPNYVNYSEKRNPMYEAELNKFQQFKNKLRSMQGINVEKNLEVNRNIMSLTQQLRNLPFAAITCPSDALNVMKAKLMESKRPPNQFLPFDLRNPNMCMQTESVLRPENRYPLCNDRCCANKMIPNGPAYPNAFRCHEPPYKPNNLPMTSVPFVNQGTEKANFKDFTWPKALAGISKNRQLQLLCPPKPLAVIPYNKFSPYFIPERRCAPLLQGVLEDSTYRTHLGKILERTSTSIPEPIAKNQRAPPDPYPCIDYSKQNESAQKITSNEMPINRNSNEGISSHRMIVESSADLKSEGNGPSFNNWSTEAEIKFLINLRQTRSENTGDDSNQSIQVEVASVDSGDPLSSFDSGTGYNSPAYGCETPFRENSTDCNSNAVTDPVEDLEDQEVSTITSQDIGPTAYSTYNDDCGTPVMDEKDAEEMDGSPCQGKIVSLSVLKQIPELPALASIPTGTSINQNQCDIRQRSVNNLPVDSSPNCYSVIGCLDASRNFNPINMINPSKDADSLYENRPVNTAQVNSEFIEPSPKPKPTIDIDSEYQKTPLKMRIKRRISQCADINEAFNLSPSDSLKPIEMLATQALERKQNESAIETGVDSLSQISVNSISNYPTDLSLPKTPEQEKDENLLYQESWYKKLGKTKTLDKTPNQQHPNSTLVNNSQCTSDNSDALAMLQLSGNHLNVTSSAAAEDTPLSAKNEGRRRKPIRVRKLTDLYDRDNVANESDMSACAYPIQPTVNATHSLFTYPGVVQPQQAVETTVPLPPISVLQTTYNPEDIKAATILSDMLKTSYKIDESLKYRSPKTPKTRKTTSPRSNKQTSLQFRRMTRSTSHLVDKLPFINTTNALQLILPTTTPQLPPVQDPPPVQDSPPVANISCTDTIWQQDKTKEILRSLTAKTSQDIDKVNPCQSEDQFGQKSNSFSLSNSSSDSDDVGKLVIDMDTVSRSAANCPSIGAVDQTALQVSKPIVPKTCEVPSKASANMNATWNLDSVYKFKPGTAADQPQNVKNPKLKSPEYDVSPFYPIVQLTELTPDSESKGEPQETDQPQETNQPKETHQPRSYVRQNGRRVLNSPKASAEKQNKKPGKTAKSKKSPVSRAAPKAKTLTLNGRQTKNKSHTEAKTAVLPSESASELSTPANSPQETPEKILPFSVDAILRDCKSSPQKPTPEIDNPSQVPEIETNSQEFWLKAFLLMRKSTDEVSNESKEKQIQATSPSVKEPRVLSDDGHSAAPLKAASDALLVQDLKATTVEIAAISADKRCRRKKSLLPTRKIPKCTSITLVDTKVNKSEKDSSINKEKPKNEQPKTNRRKYNRTVKQIISANDSLETERTKRNNQIKEKYHTEIPEELTAAKETDSSACKIKPAALNDPAPQNAQTPTVDNSLLVCQKIRKSKSVEDIVARLSKTINKSKLNLVETPPASDEVSANVTQQQEPKKSDVFDEDVVNCERTKERIEKQSFADENKNCEKPEQVIECNANKSKRGRRKSEKKRFLEIIVEDKMETQLNEDQKIKAIEIDSSEITAIKPTPVEAEKPINRRKSHQEVESKDQSENASLADPTPPVVADKPKPRRSSTKKVENKTIDSKEEDKSDGKVLTLATNKNKTKLCHKSDEQIENNDSEQKETKSPKGDKTLVRDESIENHPFEITAIDSIPVEAYKLRNRRKSNKEVESKDQSENASLADPIPPVVADKPKPRRSSTKKVDNKKIDSKEEEKSKTNKNKIKLCHNSDEQIENIDSEQKETKLSKEDKTLVGDESVENDLSELPAIHTKPVEADKLRNRRKSHKEVESEDQSKNASLADPTSPIVADKPKRRRSSSKKIENKAIESIEEDKSDGKSLTSTPTLALCHTSDEQIANSGSEQKETKSPKEDKTLVRDESIENDSFEITAIDSIPVEAYKLRIRRKSHKEVESNDIDSNQSEHESLADPTSPVVADKPKRRRSSSKKIENKAIESKGDKSAANKNKTKMSHKPDERSENSDSEKKETKLPKEDITLVGDGSIENDLSELPAMHTKPVEADKLRNRRKSCKEVESNDQSEKVSLADPTSPVVADKPKRRRSSSKKIENKAIESIEEDKSDGKPLTSTPTLAVNKNKTKICHNSDEQIENNDSEQKETKLPKEDKTLVRGESIENDSFEITAIDSIPVESYKLRIRRKSHKEVESNDNDSIQSEHESLTEPTSPVVADKPKRRRSSNKKTENKAIESKEDKSAANKNKTKICHNSDEQIENNDSEQKETNLPKEDKTLVGDESIENDSFEITAIDLIPVEADKLRNRRKSHKEVESNDIDSKQLNQSENASLPDPTSALVADKPKRRRSSSKKVENKMIESKESDGKSVTTDRILAANKNTIKLCHKSEENCDRDQKEPKSPKDEKTPDRAETSENTPKTTSAEENNEQSSEITTVESVGELHSPVVAEKILPDKANKKQNEVCKSKSMPNVDVEKCHLKRKCIMQIRRLSIDENNLKMTLSKSKEIVEKHSKHGKKHSKRARRFSADIIRRNEEMARKVKIQRRLCNDDKLFKMIKLKRTGGTISTAKSTASSVDGVVACETASIAQSKTVPAAEPMNSSLNDETDVNNSTDDDGTNLDVSNEETQAENEMHTAEYIPHEGSPKLPQSKSKVNVVENIKLSAGTSVDELPLKVDEVNETPSKEGNSAKSLKRPAPRSQKANDKSKRRRVEDVTSSISEESELAENILEEHVTGNTNLSESTSDTEATDSSLGVFKIVRSTVAQRYKPGPKSRKRLNSQHTTDRKRLVVLLRKIKPVKRTPEEAFNAKNVQPEKTKSGKIFQRRSLDCDNSRTKSSLSLRLRSKSTDMKRSPSGDQQSRKLKPFKLNISKLEACHKTLKEMNSTEPTTSYEAKLYDESERLAEQLNSFIKKILEDSEDSSSMLLTSRPQIFDRVPKDIFAGNGDVSDNIGAKYYSPILPPKPYDIILQSKPSEDGHLKTNAVDEKEKIKPRGDANDQDSENEDSENANNSDGNSAPDLELDASEMPHIPDVGIICDEDSIPDLCAEAECLSEVLDEKINKEVLDANIDTSTPFIRDYMISGNYRSNNYLDLPLPPEFDGISLLGVQNQFKNDNSDGDGLLVPKVENLADVEIDFGSELFLYSGCIQSQDSSGSSVDEKREQECETPTPAVDAYLNSTQPTETVSNTTANGSEIVNEMVTEEVIQDTSSTSSGISQNQSPPVEVASAVGFQSYNELLAESNPFFMPPVLKDKQSNEMSGSETQSDKEATSPNTPEDILNNSTKEISANATRDTENESLSVENPNSETDNGKSTTTDKEVARDSIVDTKDLPAKTKRDRIKVLPIESLKPEEICAPVKLKSRPIPFWKIKKIENKTTSDSVTVTEENKTSTNSVQVDIPKIATPPLSASTIVPELNFDIGQPVEGVNSLQKETNVVKSEPCEDTKNIVAPPPCEKPLKDNAEGVLDDSTEGEATQLIQIPQLPELNEIVENKNQLNQNKPKQPTQISQLPELNDTVENKNKLDSIHNASNTSQDKQMESIQISQLPELNEIANNKPDFDHTYTSIPHKKIYPDKLPELNAIPENTHHLDVSHSNNSKLNTITKPPIKTLQKLQESNGFGENKHKLDTKQSCENLSKKIRSDTAGKLSIDDLFDRLKRESPVNPLMHKVKYTLQKTASFDTDDNSSRDSNVGLLTVPESPHSVVSSVPSPATFMCESPLPIIAPSMPIISTPSRHDSSPESIANNSSKSTYNTNTSKALPTAQSSPAADMHSKESDATYVAPSTSKDLKRPHAKIDIETPEDPPKKIAIKANANTPCVEKLEHVQASTDCGGSAKTFDKTHKTDKNIERLKKSSSAVTSPVSSPKHDMKPIQRVHFSSEIIEIPKVDLLLSASKGRTESPRHTSKPMKSILVSPSKHSRSPSSESLIFRKGKYKMSENNSLEHSSPISDGCTTSSHSQKVNSLKVNSKSSPYNSSRADKSVTPKTSQTSKSQTSTDITENNRHKKLHGIESLTPSNHSRLSSSTEMLIAALTSEIESIANTLERLPEPKTYAQHNYRKHTRELHEQKLQHLHELQKRRYKETEKHNQTQLRSKSYSERQPFNSSTYRGSAQSSHRETKERSNESRRPYENKFGELGTKHCPIVDTYESRVGNCREVKRLPSWNLKEISADEIIADLKMKKSRRN